MPRLVPYKEEFSEFTEKCRLEFKEILYTILIVFSIGGPDRVTSLPYHSHRKKKRKNITSKHLRFIDQTFQK